MHTAGLYVGQTLGKTSVELALLRPREFAGPSPSDDLDRLEDNFAAVHGRVNLISHQTILIVLEA